MIYHEKPKFDSVQSKVGSKDNINHSPAGGHVKVGQVSILNYLDL